MNSKKLYAIIALLIGLSLTALNNDIVAPRASTAKSPALAKIKAADIEGKWWPVTKVIDGDTLDINVNGASVRVRLIGLDTPETVDPRKIVQCFGREASDKAKQILTGSDVGIELDSSQGTYDKYGRLLAYVYAPLNSKQEGLLFNKYMIAEGYGHEYTYDLPYKYQKEFKAAEKSAREGQKGLWASSACNGDTTH